MKIVYMGTPEIAKVCLEKLYTEGFDIAAVYTKPDTPKNRGMKLIPSEVKAYAVSVGLPVVQPQTLKDDGYTVADGPRTTGDGYYESCVIGFEGNQIEITV